MTLIVNLFKSEILDLENYFIRMILFTVFLYRMIPFGFLLNLPLMSFNIGKYLNWKTCNFLCMIIEECSKKTQLECWVNHLVPEGANLELEFLYPQESV